MQGRATASGDRTVFGPILQFARLTLAGLAVCALAHNVRAAEPVVAALDLNPDTLNLKSKGRWVTCYVELPVGYDVGNIDVGSLLLEGTLAASDRPTSIGDYDTDGIQDLMVKFSRPAVIELLGAGLDPATTETTVTVTVTGTVAGDDFLSTDAVRLINPGLGNRWVAAGQTLAFSVASLAEGLTGTVTYAAENLPVGATLNSTTGWFSWTPTPDQIGVYPGVTFIATDGVDEVAVGISITAAVEGTLDFKPETLNLKSKGRWVTCYIELPVGYDVDNINTGSLLLEGSLAVNDGPTTIGDYDTDGIQDLMVKFSRPAVIELLGAGLDPATTETTVTVTVTGTVAGDDFLSTDAVRLINPGLGNRWVAAGQTLAFSVAVLSGGVTETFTYSAHNLPAGAALDPNTGLFTWTPTSGQIGVYSAVRFTATSGSDVVVDTITVTVELVAAARPAMWRLYR